MPMSAVSVSYTLRPPPNTANPPSLQPETAHVFPLEAADKAGQAAYYRGLSAAVLAAKAAVGDELTAWRDAVGSGESSKEAVVKKDADEDGEDGEGDEE